MISSQKKIWLPEQDEILRSLYEEQGLRNWSEIAKKMSEALHLSRKSAKQCRQRYENHINTETAKLDWTIEEELMLIQFHNEVGNKWALIAQKIPGKSDNSVKNHFYSKLRKVLRKLNTVIHSYLRREYRQININVIYKIVEACEEQFKEKPSCEEATSRACRGTCKQTQRCKIKCCICRCSKRKATIPQKGSIFIGKSSGMSTQSANSTKGKARKAGITPFRPPTIETTKRNPPKNDPLTATNPTPPQPSKEKTPPSEPPEPLERDQPIVPENLIAVTVTRPHKKDGVIIQEEEQGIRDLLKDAGLLQFERPQFPQMVQPQSQESGGLKFSSKSSFKSYSEKSGSDHQFFEDSDMQKGFFSKDRKNSCFKNMAQFSEQSQGQPGPGQFYYNS